MRILFVNQYYWPDLAATSQMLTDLCEHVARQGHEVHVLCSTGQYDHGAPLPRQRPRRERRHDVHIRRLGATGFGKHRLFGRIVDYLSFHLLVGLRLLLRGRRYDLIVTLTTPPLIGVYATVARWLSFGRTRHVCWVMDLHPDCEFALGLFRRGNPGARFLAWLNDGHFRRADGCVVLGPHMRQRLLDKGVDGDRITTIRLWGHDPASADAEPDAAPLAAALPAPAADRCVVMYSGNAGLVHTFEAICRTMLALRDDPRFVFLFVGGGRRMGELRRFVAAHGLTHVHFAGYVPRPALAGSLALGDVHLVSLRPGLSGLAVPCKLYGIMAAGRPVAFVGPSACETAEAIAAADCGGVFDVDDAVGLTRFLQMLADDPTRRRHLGANARSAFAEHHRAEVCCSQWDPLLATMAA